MSDFMEWLTGVLTAGESILPSRPQSPSASDLVEAEASLLEAFHDTALDIAGPPLEFDPVRAKNAALMLYDFCLYFTGQRPADPPPQDRLGTPSSASAHLSADTTLRYLPAVHRRLGVRGIDDQTAVLVEAILRRWPLSGVRADISAPPESPLDFFGHSGLQLFYAELLLEKPRLNWVPPSGIAREWVQRVFHENEKSMPTPVVSGIVDEEK